MNTGDGRRARGAEQVAPKASHVQPWTVYPFPWHRIPLASEFDPGGKPELCMHLISRSTFSMSDRVDEGRELPWMEVARCFHCSASTPSDGFIICRRCNVLVCRKCGAPIMHACMPHMPTPKTCIGPIGSSASFGGLACGVCGRGGMGVEGCGVLCVGMCAVYAALNHLHIDRNTTASSSTQPYHRAAP